MAVPSGSVPADIHQLAGNFLLSVPADRKHIGFCSRTSVFRNHISPVPYSGYLLLRVLLPDPMLIHFLPGIPEARYYYFPCFFLHIPFLT